MKAIVFAYHNMGIIGINKLLKAGFDIPLVFTHQDNPDENIWFGSVVDLCKKLPIEYVTPENPNSPEWIKQIQDIKPDIIFSFYYRYMISKDILEIPHLGAYNLHGSYLPTYRGRCPINWVIIKGESYTGVTLHEMVEKPDAGPIVAQKKVKIENNDTTLSLFKKLGDAASDMLDEVLPEMNRGVISKTPQDLSKGSYFCGRKPEDGRIIWSAPAEEIYNLIRGVTKPYPGAFGFLSGKKIIFWWATVDNSPAISPGKIIIDGKKILISTGRGSIIPHEIELEGKPFKEKDLYQIFERYKGETLQ